MTSSSIWWPGNSGGDAQLRIDLLSSTGSERVSFLDPGIGALIVAIARKLEETVNILSFGGIGDNATTNTVAFSRADANYAINKKAIYVPPGIFRTANIPTGEYFGEGIIFTQGENFYLDSKIPTSVNTGIPTPVDPDNPDQSSRYFNIFIGQRAGLAVNSPDARACTGMGAGVLQTCVIPARGTAFGKQVFRYATYIYSSDGFGADACGQGTYYDRCAGFGANALKWAGSSDPVAVFHDYYRNTGVGDGDFLTAIQLNAVGRWPTIRADFVGSITVPNASRLPTGPTSNTQNIAMGRNALLHLIKGNGNTAVGANALAHALDVTDNTAVGVRAGRDCASGIENVFIGASAGMQNISGVDNVAIGYSALLLGSHTSFNTAIGYRAAASLTGTDVVPAVAPTARRNVYVGAQAGENATNGAFSIGIGSTALRVNTAGNNVAIGAAALVVNTSGTGNVAVGSSAQLATTTGSSNTAIGFEAQLTNSTGSQNTAVGQQAGRFDVTGATANFDNAATLGYRAQVSASNQVQLGNTATTTYVYGTVQNRSDIRDKTDVIDSVLGLDFILGLRAVEGRWDLREDYFEDVLKTRIIDVVDTVAIDGEGEDAETAYQEITTQVEETYYDSVPIPKDGSKARARKHQWFIAQEVKALCDQLGVEFGGYQDHTITGGCDILSLGYDEFIPPMVKAIQELKTAMDTHIQETNRRLDLLEGK